MLGRGVLTLVTILALAGCIAPAADVAPNAAKAADLAGSVRVAPPDKDLSKAIVSDHGAPYMHAIPSLHTGSYRMDLAGWNAMAPSEDPTIQNGAYTAITLWGHLACVSHFAGTGGLGGFDIVNFTDPKKPVVVASVNDMKLGSRCQFTDDGKFILAAAYTGASTPLSALGPQALAGENGVTIYDAKDPAHPKFLAHDTTGVETGPATGDAYHNFQTAFINGTNYVVQTYTGNVLALAPDGKSLKIVGHVKNTDHDVWIGKHPITGNWTMVSGAGLGTAFYAFDDPSHPELLGVYEGSATYPGWHRQWPLAETVGGKAIMIVAGEECNNGKSLPYTVLDWTDPGDIKPLGHWQIPGKPEIKEPGQLCSMNSHEFSTWNGYVATGNYHAGIWVFDAGTPERTLDPVTIGYYEPHQSPPPAPMARSSPFAWNPDVWGAYFDDRGYVLAADWSTGFYVLSFPGTPS